MAGNDTVPLSRFSSLIKQRSVYVSSDKSQDRIDDRFIHRLENNLESLQDPHISGTIQWIWAASGYISTFKWTPWPQLIERTRLEIKNIDNLEDERKSIQTQDLRDFSSPKTDVEASSIWYKTCRGIIQI